MNYFLECFNSIVHLCRDDMKNMEARLAEFFDTITNEQLENLNLLFKAMRADEEKFSKKKPEEVEIETAQLFDYLLGKNSNLDTRGNLSREIVKLIERDEKYSQPKGSKPRLNFVLANRILNEIDQLRPHFKRLFLPRCNESIKRKIQKFESFTNALDRWREGQPHSASLMYERTVDSLGKSGYGPSISPRKPVTGQYAPEKTSTFAPTTRHLAEKKNQPVPKEPGFSRPM